MVSNCYYAKIVSEALTILRSDLIIVQGHFNRDGDLMDGTFCSVSFADGSKTEGRVSNGAFHGLVRTTDRPLKPNQLLKRYKALKKSDLLRVQRESHSLGFTSEDPIAEVRR